MIEAAPAAPGSAAPADPLALLRARTHERHEALEASPWLAAATRDLAAYARHLARVEALHRDAERAFAPHRAALARRGFAPDERRKLPALREELASLACAGAGGGDVPVAGPAAGGEPAAFPPLASLSAAVGCAYVLEGATLGGLLIARTVRDRLGWESAFYAGYGARTAARWREFGAAVRAAAAVLDPQALVGAANATFDAYGARVADRAAR